MFARPMLNSVEGYQFVPISEACRALSILPKTIQASPVALSDEAGTAPVFLWWCLSQ
jgi:hypothetical protein